MTTAILKIGLRVWNFSSPHGFLFDDGTILGACSPERAKEMSIISEEEVVDADKCLQTIKIRFRMNNRVLEELEKYEDYNGIIILPLPVMNALKEVWPEERILNSPYRTIRRADRVTKTVRSDMFCI